MPAPNPERQRAARQKLQDLLAYPASVFLVHYACQDFDQGQRLGSPRVTAICARNVESGATFVFSINREAELARLGPVQVLSRMDELEYSLLEKFFEFVALNQKNRFVHWNMRDATFGFAAIEHRFSVLGGTPVVLAEAHKLDLARAFSDMFGSRYVPSPYLKGLSEKNNISLGGFLDGPSEAEAFERGAYDKVQRSVLAKVRILFDVLHLAHDGTLKTDAGWWTLNAGRLREGYEMFDKNPLYAVLTVAVAIAFGAFKFALDLMNYWGM